MSALDTAPRRGPQDLRVLLALATRHWYLFVICLLMASGAAMVYLKFAQPMYRAEAQVRIKEERSFGEDVLFSELGMGRKPRNLENEVLVMMSSPLMVDVIIRKNLHYRYFRKLGPVLRELYADSPIRILDWSGKGPSARVNGEVVVVDSTRYRFIVDDTEYSGAFGEILVLPQGKLVLWTDGSLDPGEGLIIAALSEYEMAGYFQENLEVSIAGEESSVIMISLKDPIPQRAYDVLTGLIEAYNKHSVEEKNRGYQSAIQLISERLEIVAAELSQVESDVERFKSSSIKVEVGAEGTMLLTELADYDKKISELETQMRLLDAVEDLLSSSIGNKEFVPTDLGVTSPALTKELMAFNEMLGQRQMLERRLGPDHPDLQTLDKRIENQRKTISDNLSSMKREMSMRLRSARQQMRIAEERTRSLPGRQRGLVERERRKGVVENLFLYLLQKREELSISMAVTTSSGSVVEPPQLPEVPMSPKGKQVWMIALFLGLAIPSGGLAVFMVLNDRVADAASIARVTGTPIIGTVAASDEEGSMVVREKSHSPITEMFRLLRTDLMYLTPGEELKVIMITSSVSGEGKSFISMNLGMSLALAGRKVMILELDLRKPKQERYFGLPPGALGIVNFLVDPHVRAEQIVQNSGFHPGLDVILSGPTPPNPGELILSKRLRELLTDLKRTYDTIILDTPPVGMVADALQMADLPQATMYVVRAGYTRLPQLKVIDDIHTKGKLPRPFIVLNGASTDSLGTYGGYTYGYYHQDEDKEQGSWMQRLFGGGRDTGRA